MSTVSEQVQEPTRRNNTAISHGWATISNLSAIANDYTRLNPGPFLKWVLPIFQDLHMLQDAIIPALTEALQRLEATTTQIVSYADTIDALRREKDDKQTRINELETQLEFRKQPAPEPTPPCAACKFPDTYKVVSLEEFGAYQRLLKTMEQIGLFLRANYTTEIASGLHTGRTDADIITMYLYRERTYHKELEATAKSQLEKSTAKSGTRSRTRSRGGNR